MVLGDPVAVIAEPLGQTREVERVAQRIAPSSPSGMGDWSSTETRILHRMVRTPRPGGLAAGALESGTTHSHRGPIVTTTLRPRSRTRPLQTAPGPGGAAVASVGMSLPETVVHSSEIEERLGLAPDWIERRTGIRARRIAAADERLEQHATAAAQAALRRRRR